MENYDKDFRSSVILFLFIFQMMGVRVFQGIGIVISILLFVLMIGKVRLSFTNVLATFVITLLFAGLQLFKNADIYPTINVSFQIVNAILLSFYYRDRSLVSDLTPVLKFFAYQALATLVVDIIVPFEKLDIISDEVNTRHLFYIFYVMPKELIGGIHRLSGLAWEPGCFQLLLNFYLFINIQDRSKNIKDLWWIVLLILATGSTSGYVIMLINFMVYFFSRAKSNFFVVICAAIIFAITVLPYIWENIADKLMLESDTVNTSGVIRYRDFYTGLYCLRDFPLLGIDMTADPTTNNVYQTLEKEAIEKSYDGDWYQYFDFGDGGYTNGLFGMTMMWGIAGLYLLYCFIRCSLWKQFSDKYWYIIPLIFCLSLVSEPISNTAFFWFFCIYNIVNKDNEIIQPISYD